MAELGNKHECLSCSTKFYDLGKNALICPKCGADQKELAEAGLEHEKKPKARKARAKKKKKAPAKAKAKAKTKTKAKPEAAKEADSETKVEDK